MLYRTGSHLANILHYKSNSFVIREIPRQQRSVDPVRKPGTQDKFHLIIDYGPVTKATATIAGSMPSAATMINAFKALRLLEVSISRRMTMYNDRCEVFSFITSDGVNTPKRVPQGAMDSALHFQSQVQMKLVPLIPHSVLVWVHNVILFAPTIPVLLQTEWKVFNIVEKVDFKLDITKSSLVKTEMKWCGRLISSVGACHDPTRANALAGLALPVSIYNTLYVIRNRSRIHFLIILCPPLQKKLNSERTAQSHRVEYRHFLGR
ncbi:LOW QUALITY PROTEIN: Retrovirusrelated Pol Polyprotein [Phytophthora palmivora]|uniref:Retrovirusrelated Pol Polyprotein n=1 Tax=Phytophthora palmivora TaxID=4796 RepID=A0A2P4XAV7_9STRA|nr:LOW QUALITY PROTEIN: Retrovirusrelated Pol Polyprotein [Phytophthora palmivora]